MNPIFGCFSQCEFAKTFQAPQLTLICSKALYIFPEPLLITLVEGKTLFTVDYKDYGALLPVSYLSRLNIPPLLTQNDWERGCGYLLQGRCTGHLFSVSGRLIQAYGGPWTRPVSANSL